MKVTYTGTITRKLSETHYIVFVDYIETAFEVYSEKPVLMNETVEISVHYYGIHNLKNKTAYING